ncbi:LOW QUALITY PROTEIN: hypothetical protein Ct61P_12351 [Colletotrichum tofieldiae]|nr:LOW QUALITY PROTEIN: hypothetical protein Ct61P_12351 [Colletotrichum tofieldiae]
MALAAFSTLEVTPQPNGGMASSLSSLSIDFTTPTKAGASPKSKSTTKKQAPNFASLSLASPSKKYSTAETPRPNKGISTDLKIVPLAPSTTRTPSPKKVSFADESFTPLTASTPKHFSASTPKFARGLSPKSSPLKPALSDFSVMSITSPATPQLSHDQSDPNQGPLETRAALVSPSKSEDQEHENGGAYESPSKADTTMHDITMMSDFTVASPRKPQGYTFASTELSETAKKLWGLILEKAIARRVVESLAVEELDAAAQFRHIAVKGELAQRVAEATEEDYSEPYWLDEEVEERPVINMIEARRVLRNDLFSLPAGPSVREQRQQYKADMQKYGQVMGSTKGKRNYDGEPKRAYNNALLTHAIMKPLLAFPMPDLSFEWVLETAIRDSNKAHGREQEKHRNVRQPIAVFGESDFSVIEEEEEPQSPTAKLPHFPSSATHHSEASRKTRLDQGLVSLRSKIAAFDVQEPDIAPVSPLSSPIGPGFTFEVPSFISSPSVTQANDDEVEEELDEPLEPVASPIVYFKDRSQTSPFKKRKSLPATRRPSVTSLLRRDLQDPASGPLVGAPDSSVELLAVQDPSVVDPASAAFVQASPASAGGVSSSSALALASPAGSPSPSPVVVDVRENPDIFGSFQERPGSPVQALPSLAHVFEDAEESMDSNVAVSKEDGRLIVRFKVSEEHAALIAAEDASLAAQTSPVAQADQEEEHGKQDEKEDEEVSQMPDQAPALALDDDSDLVMLREFMSRHAARKAAKAAEPAEPVEPADLALSPTPAPVLALSPTPFLPPRFSPLLLPLLSVLRASGPTRRRSRSRLQRSVLALLDGRLLRLRLLAGLLELSTPRKVKRKADDVEEREVSPEKKPQPPKRQRREKAEKPGRDENEKPKEDENANPAEEDAPVPGVRTRAQRAAERGEVAPATKIPMRHKGYAKVRSGEKDLASLTRQNTRTNKGSALPAEQVLESLKNAPPTVETRAAAAARKDGKSVQWAEQLARSQSEEPSSTPLSPAEEKQVGKTRGRAKGSTNKTTAAKASTTSTSSSTTTKATTAKSTKLPRDPGPKTESAKVTKPKKVTAAAKKELGLSANGTPAKRSARIAKK